jgi:hypothetical protein
MSQESTKPYLYFEQIMNGIVSVPESVKAKLSNVLLVRRQQLEKNREQEQTETEKSSITSWFSSPESSSRETDVDEEPEEEKSKFSIASWFSSNNKESEESDKDSELKTVKQEQQLGENAKPGLDKCNIRGW